MSKKTEQTSKNPTLLNSTAFEEQEPTLKGQRVLPQEQKVTRALITQTPQLQRSLFDMLEEQAADSEGNVMYSKLPSAISEYDFRAYLIAAKATLFDQSYLCGNDDINSGFNREQSNLTTTDGLHDEDGKPYVNGNICVTLNELCRVGYGLLDGQTPTTKQRNSMRNAIEALHNNPIGIVYANGDTRESRLIVIMDKYTRKKDNAETYHLILNPIFTTQGKGYGVLQRGATTKLTQYLISQGKTGRAGKNAEYYAFLEELAIQKKGKVWTISVENLLHRLNLIDQYRKDKKRTIAKLEGIFEAFVALGYLLDKPTPTIPVDGIFRFRLHPDPKRIAPPEEDSTPT